MKKIYLFLVTLFCVFASSCSNEDIEIEAYSGGSLILRVNTQGVYDTFGITQRLRDEFMREGSYNIGVTSLLYDAKGTLVEKNFQASPNFNRVEQKFDKIQEGKYTVVTIQMIADPDKNNQNSYFKIEGEGSLRTLKISQQYAYVSDINAIGINTQTITTGKKDLVVDVTPKAIGSRVEVYYKNALGNLPYDNVGFGTTDMLDCYLLDPSLSEKDRYQMDLSSKGKFNLRGELTVQEADEGYYNVLYFVEKNIEYCFAWNDDSDGSSWYLSQKDAVELEDGENYFAGIYFHEDKTYHGTFRYAEEYKDWLEEMENVEQNPTPEPEPEPEPLLYDAPYTNWDNGTFNAVKNYMSGYNASSSKPEYNEEDDNYTIMYINEEETTLYEYVFTSASRGLTDAYVAFYAKGISSDDVANHLESEGYSVGSYDKENGCYWFESTSTETVGLFYITSDNSMWIVNYYDPDAYSSTRKMEMRSVPRVQRCISTLKKKSSAAISSSVKKVDVVNTNISEKRNEIKFL